MKEIGHGVFFSANNQINIMGQLRIFRQKLGASYRVLIDSCQRTGKCLWQLTAAEVEQIEHLELLNIYKSQVKNFLENDHRIKGQEEPKFLYAMIRKLDRAVDDLTKHEFKEKYERYEMKNDFLPMQIGRIFTNYHIKYDENRYNIFRNEEYGEHNVVLSSKEFEQKYGPKPWDIVNEILRSLGSMPYEISTPEGLRRDDRYQAKLLHSENPSISPNFDDLSSGERILMALVACVYKSNFDETFPDVILLDEIDASLHPSMVQNLLDIINRVFLKNSVRVLLVTHSPTTIALAPPESIYVMNRTGAKRIVKREKNEALAILTEGFATLEEGLHILDQVARTKVSVVTEGRNVAYLTKALELAEINGVEIVSGAENRSGKSQLKILFDFFSVLPHTNKAIIVWDCDADYTNLSSKNNTYPFAFEYNAENSLAVKGIENLFDEELFTGFIKTITWPGGGKREFHEGSKVKFEEVILGRGNRSDFVRFDPLIKKIKELLDE